MASLEILAGSAVAADRAALCFSKRRTPASGAPGILHGCRAAPQADPLRAVLVVLALPDRRVLLQLLDGVPAGGERVGAVRRGGGDHHRDGARGPGAGAGGGGGARAGAARAR